MKYTEEERKMNQARDNQAGKGEKKMKTTTSVKKLKNEGYLNNGPYTNYEILLASAAYLLDRIDYTYVEDIENEAYDAIYDECDASLAATLSEVDFHELMVTADCIASK